MPAAGEILELESYYTRYKFSDADWVSGANAFSLGWDELQVQAEEAILNVWYTGERADYRTQVDIGAVSGTGSLELEGSSTNSLILFRVGDDGMAGFSGNLTLRHYSSEWDAAEMYDSAVVLELGKVEMPGAVVLDAAGYCPDDCFYVAALGLGDDATLGGLNSADYAAPAAVVYSGSLQEDAAALLHRAGFASYIDFERHTLTIDTAGVHRYHGALLGAMDVVKCGTGTQYFTVTGADAGNTYRVLGGKLVFDGAVEAASLEIGSGASFSCSGSLTLGTLSMSGGSLNASGALAVSTVSLSGRNQVSFTSCSGGSWVFTLGAENSTTPLLVLEGNAAPAQLQLVYDESELCRGWYQLVQCSNGAWTLPQQVLVNGTPAQVEWNSGVLRYYVADGQLVLPRDEATQLHWQAQSGKWQENAGHAENSWQGPDSNANFQAGDEVVFNSAAQVELVGDLNPSAVWVTHGAGEVGFTGSGKLAGEITLHKTGTGTLRISGAHTYSGTTELEHGTLVVEHAGALGSSTVLLKGGQLDLQGTALNNKLVVHGETELLGASNYAGELELQSGTLLLEELGDSASIFCTGNAALQSNGTLVLHQQLELDDDAVLTLRGSFEAGALAESTQAFMETVHGATGGESGFLRDAGCSVQLTTGNGTLDTTDAEVLLHGTAVQLNESGFGELPGALRTSLYTVAGDHEVRVSEILDIAGEQLQTIRMSSGRLLVDESTDTLHCSGGELVLEQGHVSGRIEGDCRVVVQGNVVLHSAHEYTGGTWVESGILRLAHASAAGSGAICLGTPAQRSAQSAVLDMGNLPVQNNLVLRGSSELRGSESFAGNILMETGAVCTVAAGNVLRLDAGQSLTLAPGGNILNGELVFNGGTVVLTGGALTLHGLCSFAAPTTLDLRQWENLELQQALLVLDYPVDYEEGDLLFLLPEHLADSELIYNPLRGALELKSLKPIYSPLAAALNRNQFQVYHALLNLPDGTYGALAELQRNVAEASTEDELRALLDRAGGAGYSTLLPALQEGVQTHLHRMQELAGSGHQLSPESGVSVAAQALYHSTRRSGDSSGSAYRLHQTGSHLQLEPRIHETTALGLALASVSSRISPEQELTQKEDAVYLDAYALHRNQSCQALLALGLGRHEFSLQRQRTGENSATTTAAAAESLHLLGELSGDIADNWQVYTGYMWSMARLDAITEQQDTASLHLAEQHNRRKEVSLGTRWHMTLGENLALGAHAALHYHTGELHHKTSAHFAGAPGVHFTQQSAAAPRWNYSLGAEISCPLTNCASLHASATVESESFSTHAGIILHF